MGEIASGKSIVARHLIEKREASYYRFSDVLRDILERLHLPNTRENLQSLGVALREPFGKDILANALKGDIGGDPADIIILDGIRYADEFDMIKDMGGRIIYVTAPAQTRFERVLKRGTRGEDSITLEEFLGNEAKPTEIGIKELGDDADHIIENTGTMEELLARVDEIL